MTIEIKDKDGNTLFSVPSELFPLKMYLETTWGGKEYLIKINYRRDKETHQLTDEIKSSNMVTT